MSKKNSKKRKSASKILNEQGFEFGFLPQAMYADNTSIELNDHMIKAKVVGCAYGFDIQDDNSVELPCLTFIGENPSELVAASKCLELWGCKEDGDSVDINIVLKNDGGYLIGMQPNWPRTINRVLKDDALVDLVFAGATWIKTIDTANPMLREWKDYLKSKIAPIKINFATVDFANGMPKFDTIRSIPNTLSFIKFGVTIETEEEKPDHWFFDIVRKSNKKPNRQRGPNKKTPRDVSAARAKVIDSAFPISRVRIRRIRLIEKVSTLTNITLTQSQLEQAAINLTLSREWTGGHDHYLGIDNLQTQWWERVGHRIETAGMQDFLENVDPATVLHQIVLDVEHALRRHGAAVSAKFQTNQKLFLRLGYGHA